MTKRKIAYKGKKSGYRLNGKSEESKEFKETKKLLLEIKELILKNEEEQQVQDKEIIEIEVKEKNWFKRRFKSISTRLNNEIF